MEESSPARPAKRRKIRLACQECRDKKTRCDGARPVCNACVRKKLPPEQCVYLDGSSDLDSQYVKSLEARISELERSKPSHQEATPAATSDHRALGNGEGYQDTQAGFNESLSDSRAAAFQLINLQKQRHQDALRSDVREANKPTSISYFCRPAVLPYEDESMGQSDYQRPLPPIRDLTSPISGIDHPQSVSGSNGQFPDPNRLEDETDCPTEDVMGTSEDTPGDATRPVFLGPSSAAAFMREARELSGKHRSTASGTEDGMSSTMSQSAPRRDRKQKDQMHALLETLILPARRVADSHIEKYWQYAHPFYPILHKPSFVSRYERIWDNTNGQDKDVTLDDTVHSVRAFYATLNMVLALGCIYSYIENNSLLAKDSATTFFERSQQLLQSADVDRGSIELVQAYILNAQYLQSTAMVNKCWVTVGIAIRVAQGIGIQLDMASESQVAREVRKRTWWCCILMDRVLSMTFGRPPMVTWPTTVPIPEPVDDELLSTETGSSSRPLPQQAVSQIGFFVQTVKLTDCLMSVLKSLYRPAQEIPRYSINDLSDTNYQRVALVLENDTRLAKWRKQLPDYLVCRADGGASESDPVLLRQAASLYCRYLHLRILLFRPITIDLSDGVWFREEESGLSTDFQHAVFVGCIRSSVKAAQALIKLIHSPTPSYIAPPWWYAVFYLYTAGTVLLVMLRSPGYQSLRDESMSALQKTWTQCMESLSRYESMGSSFARQCRRVLETTYNNGSMAPPSNGQEGAIIPPGDRNNDDPNTAMNSAPTQLQQHLPLLVPDSTPSQFAEGGLNDVWWPAAGYDWLNALPEEQEQKDDFENYGGPLALPFLDPQDNREGGPE